MVPRIKRHLIGKVPSIQKKRLRAISSIGAARGASIDRSPRQVEYLCRCHSLTSNPAQKINDQRFRGVIMTDLHSTQSMADGARSSLPQGQSHKGSIT